MGKLGEEEEEPTTERRKEYIDLDEREEQVACHASALALAMTDESVSGNGEASLTMFITRMSGDENLTSFTNRFFHFSGTPGFRLAFDTKGMENLAAFSVREAKRVAEERDEYFSAEGQ